MIFLELTVHAVYSGIYFVCKGYTDNAANILLPTHFLKWFSFHFSMLYLLLKALSSMITHTKTALTIIRAFVTFFIV